MKSIGETLLQLRTERDLSQRELAELLCEQGIQVTNQAVSKWENGSTLPNAWQFLALLRVFRIQDALSVFAGTPAENPMSRLNREGKAKVETYINDLLATGCYDTEPDLSNDSIRQLPLYSLAASAGTGQFLDESDAELIPVGGEVPPNADFGIRLAGDSMEPRYRDGEIVWVQQQNTLRPGEIGIFLYDGCAYCKRLARDRHGVRLVSLNPAYAPITLRRDEELTVFGRVVS